MLAQDCVLQLRAACRRETRRGVSENGGERGHEQSCCQLGLKFQAAFGRHSGTARAARGGLFALVVALAAVIAAALTAAGGASAGAGSQLRLSALELETVVQINEVRTEHGLSSLGFNPGLFDAASAHCSEMVAGGFFGHQTADGATFAQRLEAFYPRGRYGHYAVGENLLWGNGPLSSAGMVRHWMESPEHRRNLLDPEWRQIGLATLTVLSAFGFAAA